MEDVKKQINYMLEKLKRDIKNTEPLLQEPNQKLQFVNDKLDMVYLIALADKKPNICNTIIKYWEEQRKTQDEYIENSRIAEEKLIKNKDNILEHLMREL